MTQIDVLSIVRDAPAVAFEAAVTPLSALRKGDQGVIIRVGETQGGPSPLEAGELERRLLELGFVEGAHIELIHEGLIGHDPIAVRLDDMRVALRRREAANIFVQRTGRSA